MSEILILVHPGSLCGSARSSLGRLEADAAREEIFHHVAHHDGGLIVIDGALSDELSVAEEQIINSSLARADRNGYPAARLWGCDSGTEPYPEWTPFSRGVSGSVHGCQAEAARDIAPLIAGHPISVTGAWATEDDSEGCVNDVVFAIRRSLRGKANIRIHETALLVPDQDLEPDEP